MTMNPSHPRLVPSTGFTLVELLIGVVLGGISLAAVASVAVSHIRYTNRVTWSTQTQRDIAKINSFLAVEAREACSYTAGATAPANWATSPMPTPSPCTTACTSGAGTQLRMLVPFSTNVTAQPVPRVIRYYTSVNATTGRTELLRDGPRILVSGQLDPITANDQTAAVLVDGVNTFTTNVSNDCRSVTIQLNFNVPSGAGTNAGTTPLEELRLITGVRMYS